MSFLDPSSLISTLPPRQKRLYFSLRVFLYIIFFSIVTGIGYSFLFPPEIFTLDFRNPDAAKNTLLDPRNSQGLPQKKGLLAKDTPLIVNSGALGIFSDASISIQLKKDSPLPKTFTLTVQKGYREIFLPEGKPAEFPVWKQTSSSVIGGYANGSLFLIQGDVYQLFDGKLYRFVSEHAALSRYERDAFIEQSPEFLTKFPIASEWIGFRPGTLVSNATGVFVVYGETDIRPIGSALIFQALGYNWDDVIPASEEEISIYKRGKIILPGTLHAPGTLFQIAETGSSFTIDEENRRRPLIDETLLRFFLKHTHVIPVSEKSRERSSSCTLQPGRFFSHEYTCDIPLQDIQTLTGNDYQFTLATEESLGIDTINITLKRSLETGNFRSTLSQIKARLLNRYAD